MKNIESIRHGDRTIEKNGSLGESLSDIGRENTEKKSMDYYKEIKEAPEGFVFFTTSSNVERAVDTRNILDDSLENLISNNKNIEIISVKDLDKIDIAKNDKVKKYIIKDFSPSSLLGTGIFEKNKQDLILYHKLRKMYGNDNVLAIKTWVTTIKELKKLKSEIKSKFPNINLDIISPSEFVSSPEDFIIPYFKFLKRVSEIASKHFPDRPWKCLQVGHDVQLDLSSVFLLEGELSLRAFEKIKNLRNFLESSNIEINDNKIIFKYSNFEKMIEADFGRIVKILEEASEDRKQEWKNSKKI